MIVTTEEQSKRLIESGVSTKTADLDFSYKAWSLSALWDYFHNMDKTYDFDTKMTAAELLETLVRIIVMRNKRYEGKTVDR